MKTTVLCSALALLAGPLFAAESSPKDDITNAAKKLGESANYSWKTTSAVPQDSPFRPGPIEGKTEKGGFTRVTLNFFDNATQAVLKGEKAALTDPDGKWQSLAEADGAEGAGRFIGMIVRNLKTPDAHAAELASFAKELKKEGDVYSSELTDEGAKKFLTFSRQGGGGATVSSAKGSVKFWLKDGALVKYEYKVKGAASFNGNDLDIDRTTTIEIKDVGTTKVDVPEEAKKKLS
jgi:hypothetical protein